MRDRPDSLDNVQHVFETLSRQFDSMARSWGRELDTSSRLALSMGHAGTTLDLVDEEDAFVVTVDVPGYENDDLDVRLAGDRLSISGDREQTIELDDDAYLRRERELSSFTRQLQLPEPVDDAGVSATVTNGVLTVRLPKLEIDAHSHEIDIE